MNLWHFNSNLETFKSIRFYIRHRCNKYVVVQLYFDREVLVLSTDLQTHVH